MHDPSIQNPLYQSLTDQELDEIDALCDRFDRELLAETDPHIENFLTEVPEAARDHLLAELLAMEFEFRTRQGNEPQQSEYIPRFPQQQHVVARVFSLEALKQSSGSQSTVPPDETLSRLSDGGRHHNRDENGGPTIMTGSPHSETDVNIERRSGEREFARFLDPPTRPGWLGRLAHFEIEKILGRGAFGIVAKAYDEKLHRVVAIKMLSPNLATASPLRQRFLREARSAAAVTHENVVAIYDTQEEPIPYLVMEFVPGPTLQQRMNETGPMEVAEVLRVGQQIASGLAAAHAVNLIHRDIKPSNILLSGGLSERAKISDFGMARAVDDASMTRSGMIAGTPMYMAPEQAHGETLDHRADLFSLGSVLYQMAGGRPPFRAMNTLAVLKRVCEDTPPPLDDVLPGTPRWLEKIIFRLLEKKLEDRYQTAQEVADLLTRCQRELEYNGKVTCFDDELGSTGTSVVKPEKSTFFASRKASLGWLAGGVIALVAAIAISLNSDQRERSDSVSVTSSANPTSTTGTGRPVNSAESTGWHDWPDDAPMPAIVPFDAEQAKAHQEAWAEYLEIPVEYENAIGMKFRLIPPGEFLMGSTPAQIEAALKVVVYNEWRENITSETPQHKVVLTKPVYFGVTEVTQTQYEQIMGFNPALFSATGRAKEIVSGLDTDNYPVDTVSWNDAEEFCTRLSQKEGLQPFDFHLSNVPSSQEGSGYRLATDAEWEYACRAGTSTLFCSGDEDQDLRLVGWIKDNAGNRTHTVGELTANSFGLFDVHGNVWEWVMDSWEPEFYSNFQENAATDPFCTGLNLRLFRGGNANSSPSDCRTAFRLALDASIRPYYVGIRVVLPVDTVKKTLQSPPVTSLTKT